MRQRISTLQLLVTTIQISFLLGGVALPRSLLVLTIWPNFSSGRAGSAAFGCESVLALRRAKCKETAMRRITNAVIGLLPLLVTPLVSAQIRWESATNVGRESAGDPMLSRCIYQTLGGYRFSMIVRGLCPFTVEVNPETSQVKTPQPDYGRAPSPPSEENWQSATNVGRESSGDPLLSRCIYQTLGGYRFSTIFRGLCPFTVEVNPETSQVKTPQPDYRSTLSPPSEENWQNATNVDRESAGDPMLTRCIYQMLGGYRFSTTFRGLCPFTVKVNPETGEVKR